MLISRAENDRKSSYSKWMVNTLSNNVDHNVNKSTAKTKKKSIAAQLVLIWITGFQDSPSNYDRKSYKWRLNRSLVYKSTIKGLFHFGGDIRQTHLQVLQLNKNVKMSVDPTSWRQIWTKQFDQHELSCRQAHEIAQFHEIPARHHNNQGCQYRTKEMITATSSQICALRPNIYRTR